MATEAYPAVEVTLCGYPTLASARVLWEGEPEAQSLKGQAMAVQGPAKDVPTR